MISDVDGIPRAGARRDREARFVDIVDREDRISRLGLEAERSRADGCFRALDSVRDHQKLLSRPSGADAIVPTPIGVCEPVCSISGHRFGQFDFDWISPGSIQHLEPRRKGIPFRRWLDDFHITGFHSDLVCIHSNVYRITGIDITDR
jgi:hypothetical protein